MDIEDDDWGPQARALFIAVKESLANPAALVGAKSITEKKRELNRLHSAARRKRQRDKLGNCKWCGALYERESFNKIKRCQDCRKAEERHGLEYARKLRKQTATNCTHAGETPA